MMAFAKKIPNILTMFRIFGLVIATYFLFLEGKQNAYISFWLFTIIAITDLLDGYLARRLDAVTAFGKLMDPIADKAYILTLYISFAILGLISHWWIWPILIRELGITLYRVVLLRENRVIAAEKSGKIKAFLQNVSLFFLFIYYLNLNFWNLSNDLINSGIQWLALGFLWIAVLLTVYSGIDFIIKNRKK